MYNFSTQGCARCFGSTFFKRLCLAFPPTATLDTSDESGHGFICRTRLELIIAAFFGFTFATGEIVGGCFQFRCVFVLITDLLFFNQFLPTGRRHILMCHCADFMWLDLFADESLPEFIRLFDIHINRAEAVQIQLDKERIVPLLHNITLTGIF